MQVVQDTINLSLIAEQTVVNRTVKLNANVAALVEEGQTEESLRAEIKTTMNRFVDTSKLENTVEWQFSNMQRTIDATGYERVSLVATLRVPETENYNLERRAELASRPGLTITNVDVDTSVPQFLLDETESNLRVILAGRARDEAEKLSKAMGQSYRVHAINPAQSYSTSNMIRSGTIATASKTSYGSGFSGDDDTLGNASKLTMVSNITLARIHAYASENESESVNLRIVGGTAA